MSELILPVVTLFRFNSELLSLTLADVSPEGANRRLKEGQGSSIAYLTGHLMSSRYGLMKTLGAAREKPFKELFGAGVGSKDAPDYPPFDKLRKSWTDTSKRFHAALDAIDAEQALAPGPDSFPIPDQTLRGNLTFIAWHESYHVGQIGIMRTEMGYRSMRQALSAARQQS